MGRNSFNSPDIHNSDVSGFVEKGHGADDAILFLIPTVVPHDLFRFIHLHNHSQEINALVEFPEVPTKPPIWTLCWSCPKMLDTVKSLGCTRTVTEKAYSTHLETGDLEAEENENGIEFTEALYKVEDMICSDSLNTNSPCMPTDLFICSLVQGWYIQESQVSK